MYKVTFTLELNNDEFKDCIKGAQLLSAQISYDRALRGLNSVSVDESYFIRSAINRYLDELENEKTSNYN